MKTDYKYKILFLVLFLILLSGKVFANSNKFVIVFMDDIAIPISIEATIIDITPPLKAILISTIPSDTSNAQVTIEISGEVGSSVFVNNQNVGIIDNTGRIIFNLDTSGEIGIKEFYITLKDNANNTSQTLILTINKITDPKFDISYKGLTLYHKDRSEDHYQLNQLTDHTFNTFTTSKKLTVANTLLSTLFFGYPQNILLGKINSGTFISDIREGLKEDNTDKAWLENYILDDEKFRQYNSWAEPQAINILSRFYAMPELDSYFLKNWTAYILTQTIMFSPAYELESTHTPNIANVYNRIVTFLNEESGMRYLTYIHMMSEDNWRRFRSPEDNGREMLEIFLFDQDDSHVPIAGKALQNWKLNTDSDTLEVSLNQNRTPLSLFGTTIINGDDFYRELVKSNLFTQGITRRLVDFFFPQASASKKLSLTQTIVSSNPETWHDILLQIVFSEEYILHNSRAKSGEENFFSLAKKIDFKHNRYTFYYLKEALEEMHQASMKYKLGKLNRVPLDTLSFAYYHKYLREEILLRDSEPEKIDDYSAWNRHGWGRGLISLDNFTLNENNPTASLESLIHSLFQTFIYRNANTTELTLFKSHMLYEDDGDYYLHHVFNLLDTYSDASKQITQRENRRAYITHMVLDYLSRLETLYLQKEVN